MDTPFTARLLKEISDDLDWTQQDWADRTKIERTTVSYHVGCKRPIRDEHIAAYVHAALGRDKQRLLSAWIRDVFDADDLPSLLNEDDHIHKDAANWLPSPNENQRAELLWLADERVKDRELDAWFTTLLRRLGYENKAPAANTVPDPDSDPTTGQFHIVKIHDASTTANTDTALVAEDSPDYKFNPKPDTTTITP